MTTKVVHPNTVESVSKPVGTVELRIDGLRQVDEGVFVLDGVSLHTWQFPFSDIKAALVDAGFEERDAVEATEEFGLTLQTKELSKVIAKRVKDVRAL